MPARHRLPLLTITTTALALLLTATPGTAQTTRPHREMLARGLVRYTPPAGWDVANRADDGNTVTYRAPDGQSALIVKAVPLNSNLGPNEAKEMGGMIGRAIRDDAKAAGHEIIGGLPEIVQDDRFLLKIRDRRDTGDEFIDRVQMYRPIGRSLLYVNVSAHTDDQAEAERLHAIGDELLDTASAGEGPRERVYRITGIRLTPPVDWDETRVDDANGAVAVFREPGGGPRRLVVTSRVLPVQAREDAHRRDLILEEMIDDSRHEPLDEGLKRTGELAVTPGGPGPTLSTVTAGYVNESSGAELTARTLYFVMDEVLLGVTAVGPADAPEEVAQLGVQLADTVGPRLRPNPLAGWKDPPPIRMNLQGPSQPPRR